MALDELGELATAIRYEPYGRMRAEFGPDKLGDDYEYASVDRLFNGKLCQQEAFGLSGGPRLLIPASDRRRSRSASARARCSPRSVTLTAPEQGALSSSSKPRPTTARVPGRAILRRVRPAHLLLLALLLPLPAQADGDAAHSTVFNELLVGGGLVSEGVGARQSQGAPALVELDFAGIPPNADVVAAYLYWVVHGGPDDTVTVTDQAQGDTRAITGDLIGTGHDTCWSIGSNYVYRADVFDFMDHDGLYQLSDIDYTPSSVEGQGFSLVVIYDSPGSTEVTRVTLNDGAMNRGDGSLFAVASTASWVVPIGPGISRVRAHFVVADGQGEEDGPTRVSGTEIDLDSWQGVDPGGDGPMWDDDTFDITSLNLVQPGDTAISATISDPFGGDCVLFAAFAAEITYLGNCDDGDGDGLTSCDGDCDDGDSAVYPGAPEHCSNGLDDDCDGDVDECPGDDDDAADDDDTPPPDDDDTADDDDTVDDDDDTADDDDDTADDDDDTADDDDDATAPEDDTVDGPQAPDDATSRPPGVGCACSSAGRSGGLLLALLPLALAARRRR